MDCSPTKIDSLIIKIHLICELLDNSIVAKNLKNNQPARAILGPKIAILVPFTNKLSPGKMVQSNHLQLLLKVFSRRGVGYKEFGEFLTWLFRSSESTFRLVDLDNVACRHGAFQVHDLRPEFPRVSLCRSSGTWDANKGRKIVSSTARELARNWIRSNCPSAHSSPLSDDAEEAEAASSETPDTDGSDREYPVPPIAASFGSSFGRGVSSPLPAVRTGMRIYHLSYLLGEWELWPSSDTSTERVQHLRMRVEQMISDPDAHILHLCGCGLCLRSQQKDDGCVEPSHLTIGTKAINDLHTQYHAVLRQLGSVNYRRVRDVIRAECRGAQGIL